MNNFFKVASIYLLIAGLCFVQLYVSFGGLTHHEGMERAHIAREIARGNGFSTKSLTPAEVAKNYQRLGDQALGQTKDTSIAPLGPFLTSIPLRLNNQNNFLRPVNNIIEQDRVVMVIPALFLLISFALAYALCSELFDKRIGLLVVFLMAFNSSFWELARTGLPQCILLFLFLLTIYIFNQTQKLSLNNRSVSFFPLLLGISFGLLAITKWLTIWLFLGGFIYTSLTVNPRKKVSIMMLVGFLIIVAPWLVRNYFITGSLYDSWKLHLVSGLEGSGNRIFRDVSEATSLGLNSLIIRLILIFKQQSDSLYVMLGSSIVAPFFFITIFHSFKGTIISKTKWFVFFCWISGVVGMTIYGIQTDFPKQPTLLSSNQLHILFMPIMSAFGIAMITVLWGRLNLAPSNPIAKSGHIAIIAIISIVPFLLTLPFQIQKSMSDDSGNGYNFRTFGYDIELKRNLGLSNLQNNGILFSDSPSAIAWYGDSVSILTPNNSKTADVIVGYSEKAKKPVNGIYFSARTTKSHIDDYPARKIHPLSLDNPWSYDLYRSLASAYPLREGDVRGVDPMTVRPTPIQKWREASTMLRFRTSLDVLSSTNEFKRTFQRISSEGLKK